jgi:hypothetical protein
MELNSTLLTRSQLKAETSKFFNLTEGTGTAWPDGYELPGLPVTLRTFHTMTTGVAGNQSILVAPGSLVTLINQMTFTAGNTFPMTAVGVGIPAQSYISLATDCSRFRVVSASIRCIYMHNNLENQGAMVVKMFDLGRNAAAGASFCTTFFDVATINEVDDVKEGASIECLPLEPKARLYHDVDTPNLSDTNDWAAVQITLTGCKISTDIMLVEVLQNIELTPKVTNFVGKFLSPNPQEDPAIRRAVENTYQHLRERDGLVAFEDNTQQMEKDVNAAIDLAVDELAPPKWSTGKKNAAKRAGKYANKAVTKGVRNAAPAMKRAAKNRRNLGRMGNLNM